MFLLGLIIIIALISVVIISLCLPWGHRSSIAALEREVRLLQRRVDTIESAGQVHERPVSTPSSSDVSSKKQAEFEPPLSHLPLRETASIIPRTEMFEDRRDSALVDNYMSETQEVNNENSFGSTSGQVEHLSLEQKLGAKLPIWIGGVCLALAGFFLIKYSIENSLLSPDVRTMCGGLFGLILVVVGKIVHSRPNIANSERICQALTGAGIVSLYGAFFAAGSLYDLLPDLVSFLGMVGVTITAVILSLSMGPMVAIFGLVGGFLTPALVGSKEPSTIILTLYLSVLSIGFLYLARRKNWKWIAIPVSLIGALWALAWILTGWDIKDAIWMSTYIAIVTFATPFILYSNQSEGESGNKRFRALSACGPFIALVILSAILVKADFLPLYWGMIGVVGLGSIALAVFRPAIYSATPALCALATVFLLANWTTSDVSRYLITASIFTISYLSASLCFVFRARNPKWWALIALSALPLFYVISYIRYENYIANLFSDSFSVWSFFALGVSAFSIALLSLLRRNIPNECSDKNHMLAAGALLSIGFLSWGLYLVLSPEHLMIAFALQLIGVLWLLRKFDEQFMLLVRNIAIVLLGYTLLPYMDTVLTLVLLRDYASPANFPLMPLACISGLLLLSGFLIVEKNFKYLFWVLGGSIAVSLMYAIVLAVTGYMPPSNYQPPGRFRDYTMPDQSFSSYEVRLMTLNLLWLLSLAILKLKDYVVHRPLMIGIVAYAIIETIGVDLFMYFPERYTNLGNTRFFNLLIFAFALPAIYMLYVRKHISGFALRSLERVVLLCGVLFLFMFVTFEVSHFFHVPIIYSRDRGFNEILTYSGVWLLFGLLVLIWGTLNKDKLLRIVSLLVIGLTVFKVFLYDMAALEGLWRVVSFLGLGVSLIGLGFFYARFVAADERKKPL